MIVREILKAGKPKVRVPTDWGSGERPSWFLEASPCCVLTTQEAGEAPWGLFYKGTDPVHGGTTPLCPAA